MGLYFPLLAVVLESQTINLGHESRTFLRRHRRVQTGPKKSQRFTRCSTESSDGNGEPNCGHPNPAPDHRSPQSEPLLLHPRSRKSQAAVRASAEAMATEKLGIRVERNPQESRLSELGVRQWPKWGCEASKFPWTYSAKETCYLLQGKVKVFPDGEGDFVEIAAGDLVVFPKGMSCTWDVAEAVDKHYKFE